MQTLIYRVHRNSLISILWGLIFAKCFTLEYLVQLYDIPINSTIYIWSLSLSMAAAATFVFVRLTLQERQFSMTISPAGSIWGACGLGLLLTATTGFTVESINPYLIPALLALIMGVGYCAQSLLEKDPMYLFSGFGWWLGAAILFDQSSMNGLRIMAILIIIFTVCPTVLKITRQSRERKAPRQQRDETVSVNK